MAGDTRQPVDALDPVGVSVLVRRDITDLVDLLTTPDDPRWGVILDTTPNAGTKVMLQLVDKIVALPEPVRAKKFFGLVGLHVKKNIPDSILGEAPSLDDLLLYTVANYRQTLYSLFLLASNVSETLGKQRREALRGILLGLFHNDGGAKLDSAQPCFGLVWRDMVTNAEALFELERVNDTLSVIEAVLDGGCDED